MGEPAVEKNSAAERRAIGFDLGAATTRIAILDPTKPMPIIVRNELSNEATSTIVSCPRGEARCYGENAASKQITKPGETVVDLAPWLFGGTITDEPGSPILPPAGTTRDSSDKVASPTTRKIGDMESHPAQIAAYFIKSILKLVPGEALEMPVCMSVPTCVGAPAVASLQQACLLAGMDKKNTLIVRSDEAMAMYFHHIHYASLSDDVAKPLYVTILDIGQSCCSACVVAVSQKRVHKLASESLTMGSGFIDAALCSYVYSEVVRLHGDEAIRGDVKSFRRILRECRKAKEILSTVEEARVQLEALKGDLDINIPISRALAERSSEPLLNGLRGMFAGLKSGIPPTEGEEPRVEAIGGGWRSTFIMDLIKHCFGVTRVGVTLDASLSIAEGSAILAEVCAGSDAEEDVGAGRHVNHSVELAGFEVTDPNAITRKPLSTEDEAAVVNWMAVEENLSATDSAIHQRLAAINQLDSYMLQTLEAVDSCGADPSRREAARSYLLAVDDYVRNGCEDESTENITAKLQTVTAHIASEYPEVEKYYEERRAAEKKREEELTKLSQERKAEDDDDLKSDPQRLRMAQRRREQGQELFKQDCWQEAQTRFVQALSALGQVYDTQNEENARLKREISLSCHLNIASCSVKLRLWRNAVNNCTSALDLSPDNGKALFRRGQALVALKEFSEATVDLERARVITKDDPAVVAELAKAKQALEAQKAKEKKMFAKMFS